VNGCPSFSRPFVMHTTKIIPLCGEVPLRYDGAKQPPAGETSDSPCIILFYTSAANSEEILMPPSHSFRSRGNKNRSSMQQLSLFHPLLYKHFYSTKVDVILVAILFLIRSQLDFSRIFQNHKQSSVFACFSLLLREHNRGYQKGIYGVVFMRKWRGQACHLFAGGCRAPLSLSTGRFAPDNLPTTSLRIS
jgi:hypothetical protein